MPRMSYFNQDLAPHDDSTTPPMMEDGRLAFLPRFFPPLPFQFCAALLRETAVPVGVVFTLHHPLLVFTFFHLLLRSI